MDHPEQENQGLHEEVVALRAEIEQLTVAVAAQNQPPPATPPQTNSQTPVISEVVTIPAFTSPDAPT